MMVAIWYQKSAGIEVAVQKECNYAAIDAFYFGLNARLAREGWNAYNKRAF